MIDLAEQPDGTLVPLGDTAKRQGISKKYLEIVVKQLVASGMVKGVSGKGGGYCLLREPHEYTALEVLQTTEGSLAPVACLDCSTGDICSHLKDCPTVMIYRDLGKVTSEYLDSKTLRDITLSAGFTKLTPEELALREAEEKLEERDAKKGKEK